MVLGENIVYDRGSSTGGLNELPMIGRDAKNSIVDVAGVDYM